jgi:hypothetical protein
VEGARLVACAPASFACYLVDRERLLGQATCLTGFVDLQYRALSCVGDRRVIPAVRFRIQYEVDLSVS